MLAVWAWFDVGTRAVEEALEWRDGGFAVVVDVATEEASILGLCVGIVEEIGVLAMWLVAFSRTAGIKEILGR